MKAQSDPTRSLLDLAFGDAHELELFVREAVERRAFLVQLGDELKLRSRWTVQCAAPGLEVTLEAEVVQLLDTVTGAYGTAFELWDWDDGKRAELERRLAGGGGTTGSPGEESADESETLGASPLHRIRELNPVQRSLLAAKAGRTERQILLRDSAPQVLQALMANPRLEAKEVLRMVKSTHVTAAILQRVAGDSRWGKNQEILTAVTKNPKTPPPLATRLVDKLRTQDLRMMAKMSSGLREVVRRAALKEYLRRTQR